jgi:hypothetical protein
MTNKTIELTQEELTIILHCMNVVDKERTLLMRGVRLLQKLQKLEEAQ